ncbi:hypothetical protein [Tessaracoccus flavus]|uniref:Uncharacterized protein n=1 Tax=Tessaracoccus flavus TaxID=1610493 RepID=A0A1Q2CI35_9ACTN|nr:hypothetical protein [Tessaracoccus flavus]AQP45786.1 hypothetical protein RPIT_14055 [Tessaracoccus flavus]SDZ20844.1 sulfate adenylyltransferase/protein-tyrosine phosphatase [Tessaracoccus flavus]
MRWVFVCTANISRSPYAERRMAQLLGDTSAVEVASAGIPGFDGRPMDPQMAALLEVRGVDASDHASRILTEDILRDASLVLTMEFSHHMAILEKWPWATDRVRGLGQFAKSGQRNSMVWDIADPYRRGRGAAKKAAQQIDQYLTEILPLAQESAR